MHGDVSICTKESARSANKEFKKENYEEAVRLATEASNNPETQDNPDVYILLGKETWQNSLRVKWRTSH